MPKAVSILFLCIGVAGTWVGCSRSLDLTRLQRDIVIAGGMGIGIAGAGGAVGWIARRRKSMTMIGPDKDDWCELLPARRLGERVRQAIVFNVMGWPATILAVDLAVRSSPMPTGGWIFVTMAAILLSLSAFKAVRLVFSARILGEMRLMIRPATPRRGETLDVRIVQSAGLTRATLVCMERAIFHQGRMTQLVVRVHGQQVFSLTDGTGQAVVQKSWPPTGRKGVTMYPYYTWEVRVESAGMERYGSAFPVTVER